MGKVVQQFKPLPDDPRQGFSEEQMSKIIDAEDILEEAKGCVGGKRFDDGPPKPDSYRRQYREQENRGGDRDDERSAALWKLSLSRSAASIMSRSALST